MVPQFKIWISKATFLSMITQPTRWNQQNDVGSDVVGGQQIETFVTMFKSKMILLARAWDKGKLSGN